jgi:gas vesicle protein
MAPDYGTANRQLPEIGTTQTHAQRASMMTWEEGTMAPSTTTSSRTMGRLVLAPLVTAALIGGGAFMLGRPKAGRSGRTPKSAGRGWTDPKVQKAVETAQRALDDAREQLANRDTDTLQQEIKRRTGMVAGTTRESMAPLMKDAGERARELAERLRIEGQARSVELGERMRTDVAPRARTFAQEAIDEAEEIIGEARKRAATLSSEARKNYGPEVSQGASALAGLIAAGSSAGVQMFRDRSKEMTKRNRKQRGRSRLDKGKQRTSVAMHTAGDRVKYAVSESLLIAFWAAACSAAVYFVLLTDEQRQRLKGFFSGAMTQIQDVMSDFDDVGEEFNRPA